MTGLSASAIETQSLTIAKYDNKSIVKFHGISWTVDLAIFNSKLNILTLNTSSNFELQSIDE